MKLRHGSFVFTGTSVYIMISKTVIVTLEGNTGRKANPPGGHRKA